MVNDHQFRLWAGISVCSQQAGHNNLTMTGNLSPETTLKWTVWRRARLEQWQEWHETPLFLSVSSALELGQKHWQCQLVKVVVSHDKTMATVTTAAVATASFNSSSSGILFQLPMARLLLWLLLLLLLLLVSLVILWQMITIINNFTWIQLWGLSTAITQ